MNYNLKGTNLSITPEIREYLEKKLASLDKVVDERDAARADVELEYMQGEEKTYRAEVMLGEPHMRLSLRAEARGVALHEAIDLAVGDILGELTRAKKKRRHMLRRGAGKVKDILRGFRDRF